MDFSTFSSIPNEAALLSTIALQPFNTLANSSLVADWNGVYKKKLLKLSLDLTSGRLTTYWERQFPCNVLGQNSSVSLEEKPSQHMPKSTLLEITVLLFPVKNRWEQ